MAGEGTPPPAPLAQACGKTRKGAWRWAEGDRPPPPLRLLLLRASTKTSTVGGMGSRGLVLGPSPSSVARGGFAVRGDPPPQMGSDGGGETGGEGVWSHPRAARRPSPPPLWAYWVGGAASKMGGLEAMGGAAAGPLQGPRLPPLDGIHLPHPLRVGSPGGYSHGGSPLRVSTRRHRGHDGRRNGKGWVGSWWRCEMAAVGMKRWWRGEGEGGGSALFRRCEGVGSKGGDFLGPHYCPSSPATHARPFPHGRETQRGRGAVGHLVRVPWTNGRTFLVDVLFPPPPFLVQRKGCRLGCPLRLPEDSRSHPPLHHRWSSHVLSSPPPRPWEVWDSRRG